MMKFAVPELLQTILKEDCTVEMEPLDVNFADNLITHLHVPASDFDIDVLLQEDGNIKVEVWKSPFITDSEYPHYLKVFNLNSLDFVKSITDFLLKHLRGETVKIRFQRRKEDVDSDQDKTEGSDS